MLKTLDILIGATTVLLLFSLGVTVLTQAIIGLVNTRGKHLKTGLSDLLQQLGVEDRGLARTISAAVLTHPLMGAGRLRKANVVHRDEFTKILLDLVADTGAKKLDHAAKDALEAMLAKNGVRDPDEARAMLDNIHSMALQIEAANPEISNSVRAGLAVVQGAASQYVARVHAWFDQTMDRVSERFTFSSHQIAAGVALLVVIAFQVDIVAVVNRLAIDDQARKVLVTQAISDSGLKAGDNQTGDQPDANPAPQPEPVPAANKPAAPQQTASAANRGPHLLAVTDPELPAPKRGDKDPAPPATVKLDTQAYYKLLSSAGLITPVWSNTKFNFEPQHLFGMALTVLLLTLGAPFWFNVLKNLVQLRSSLAQKDDEQRAQRQNPAPDSSDGQGAPPAATASAAAWLAGERGDLTAVG
jgi:hypothetical protein